MPATTGVSAVPNGRPGVELQAGIMPATYLSDSVRESGSSGQPTQQVSAILEPARILGVNGLILGARSWGDGNDSPFEPMLGIRRKLDDTFSLAGIAYGTHAYGEDNGANYSANRVGGELELDAKVIPFGDWVAIHGQASVSATYLDATGTYCVSADSVAIDCDDTSRRVDTNIEGVYAAATGGFSLDIARRPHGVVHNIRIAMLGSIGARPRIRDGIQQQSTDHYKSIGLSLTLGLGED